MEDRELFTRDVRLATLDEIFQYARGKLPKEDGTGYEAYRVLSPHCSMEISRCPEEKEDRGYLVNAGAHFIPRNLFNKIGQGMWDNTFIGLMPHYLGSEEGLLEVWINGIDQHDRKLLFPASTRRLAIEDSEITAVDRRTFDLLIGHVRDYVNEQVMQ